MHILRNTTNFYVSLLAWFGGEQKFKQQEERDIALRQYCKDHKIKLIEIPYWKYNNIEAILKKELKIK